MALNCTHKGVFQVLQDTESIFVECVEPERTRESYCFQPILKKNCSRGLKVSEASENEINKTNKYLDFKKGSITHIFKWITIRMSTFIQ